ncbi:Arc family DNA-binding protein [Sinorhizobium medicae]
MKTGGEKIGTIAPFGLRMLSPLRARLTAAAQESGRSLNAEIVSRLEASFRQSALEERIERLLEAFEKQQTVIDKLLAEGKR